MLVGPAFDQTSAAVREQAPAKPVHGSRQEEEEFVGGFVLRTALTLLATLVHYVFCLPKR
jgi:hypothetical protein